MARYRLHYFPASGNSYKLALMLTLCGQAFEPVWTGFGSGITRTAEWRRTVNATGEIPVLESGLERRTAHSRHRCHCLIGPGRGRPAPQMTATSGRTGTARAPAPLAASSWNSSSLTP